MDYERTFSFEFGFGDHALLQRRALPGRGSQRGHEPKLPKRGVDRH